MRFALHHVDLTICRQSTFDWREITDPLLSEATSFCPSLASIGAALLGAQTRPCQEPRASGFCCKLAWNRQAARTPYTATAICR